MPSFLSEADDKTIRRSEAKHARRRADCARITYPARVQRTDFPKNRTRTVARHFVFLRFIRVSHTLIISCPTSQECVHSAFFFSAKAFMPTFWSLLPNKLWNTLLSNSTPSLSGRSWLLFTTSLHALIATRE